MVGFDSDPGEEARDWFVNQVDPAALAEILLDDLVTNIGDKYSASSPAVVYLTTPNHQTALQIGLGVAGGGDAVEDAGVGHAAAVNETGKESARPERAG